VAPGLDRLQWALELGRGGCVRRVDVEGVGRRLSVGVRLRLADEGQAAVLEVPPLQKLAARHQDAPAVPPTALPLTALVGGRGTLSGSPLRQRGREARLEPRRLQPREE